MNTDRSVGALISNEISNLHGINGLPKILLISILEAPLVKVLAHLQSKV